MSQKCPEGYEDDLQDDDLQDDDLQDDLQDDQEEEEEEEEEEEGHFQEMTMDELLKLQEDIGTKAFRKKVLKTGGGIVGGSGSNAGREAGPAPARLKRANKNRPMEVPMMRRAAPRLASLQPGQSAKRKITRDPRFDDLSGKLNLVAWQENYGFLKEMRKKEKDVLKKELKTEHDPEKKKRMKSIVQRMENQEKEHARRQKEKEVKRLEQQEQREALRQGRKPKYFTNKERKLMVKAAHFEDLKKGNKLEKYLERKEKSLKAKEMKKKRNY